MDHRSKIEMQMLTALEEDQQISQSRLGKRLSVAAGLINILMKRAVKKGYVKVRQVPARRYAYYLTPRGFAEKSRLVSRYLESSLVLFRKLRVEYRDLFDGLSRQGVGEVVLVGEIDIVEVALMAAHECNIPVVAVVSDETNRLTVAGVSVRPSAEGFDEGVHFIVCATRSGQHCHEELVLRHGSDRVHAPAALCISPRSVFSSGASGDEQGDGA